MHWTNSHVTGRKVRFGLVGCGRISKNHIDAIHANGEHAELTAICDVDAAALANGVGLTEAKPYESLASLLADADVDAVSLATPSGLHAGQTIACAQIGRHVITEKPMATRWRDGKRMVDACDAAGVRLFVVKQNRRNPTLRMLKRALEEGRFGRIYLVTLNVFWARPQSYYDSAKWRGTWEFDGGALMNQASHYVDLVEWLIGPVESLQTYTATLARNIEVEDTGVIGLKWRSGALGSVNVTMLTYRQNFEGSITIIGEKGTVRVGGVAVNQVQTWDFDGERPEDAEVFDSSYKADSVYGHGHIQFYENVVRTLRGEAEPETDGREGLKSLELLIASYISARDGRRVSLPLDY